MATAWYCPSDPTPDADDGDYVVTPFGQGYRIGVHRSGDAGPEWLGEVAADALPEAVRRRLGGDDPQRITDRESLRALRAVATAERNRGG